MKIYISTLSSFWRPKNFVAIKNVVFEKQNYVIHFSVLPSWPLPIKTDGNAVVYYIKFFEPLTKTSGA